MDRWATPGKFFQSLETNKKFFLTLVMRKRKGGVKMASTVCSNICSILKLYSIVKVNEYNFVKLREMKAVKKFYLHQGKRAQKSARDYKKHSMRISVMKAEGKLCPKETFTDVSEFSQKTMEKIIKTKVRFEDNKMITKNSKYIYIYISQIKIKKIILFFLNE